MSAPTPHTEGSRWQDLPRVLSDLRTLAVGVVLLVALDLCASVLLSVVMPESFFLEHYLDEGYDEVIRTFRAGDALVVPDSIAGWRSRAGVSEGSWITDSMGARAWPDAPEPSEDAVDVLLIGSSVVNGGQRAGPDETLSAYLSGGSLAPRNFGTMLQSLDQSLRDYELRLGSLPADVVVVGIHADPESAANLFIPLRSRTEINMPFLKPGYRPRDDGLELIPVPPFDQADHGQWGELLAYLEENDASYDVFASYRRWGIMPVSSYLRDAYLRVRHRRAGGAAVQEGLRVQLLLLDELERSVRARGARLIVVKFAERSDHGTSWDRRIFGDINETYDQMLRDSDHEVVFVEDMFDASGLALDALYRRDGVHLTPTAYRMLADSLRSRIVGP